MERQRLYGGCEGDLCQYAGEILPEFPYAGGGCVGIRGGGTGGIFKGDSFAHKFAKKPEVIEGNMKALETTFAELAEDGAKAVRKSA